MFDCFSTKYPSLAFAEAKFTKMPSRYHIDPASLSTMYQLLKIKNTLLSERYFHYGVLAFHYIHAFTKNRQVDIST